MPLLVCCSPFLPGPLPQIQHTPTSHHHFQLQDPKLTSIQGVLSKEFLDFSASRGNNLRSIGLEPGCKWCLCTARWKEAMEAAKGKDDPVVPRCVSLMPPHQSPSTLLSLPPSLNSFAKTTRNTDIRDLGFSSTQRTNPPSRTASQWMR